MMKVLTTTRRGWPLPLVALAAAAIGLAAVQPLVWTLVHRGLARVWDDRSRTDQVAELAARFARGQQETVRLQPLWAQLSAIVPGSQDTLPVLERLEGVAQRSGVQVKIVSINEATLAGALVPIAAAAPASPSPVPEGLSSLVVTVAASGSPGQLLEYLAAVEHLPELTQIRSLTLRPFAGVVQPGSPAFEMSFDIIFYVRQQSDSTHD